MAHTGKQRQKDEFTRLINVAQAHGSANSKDKKTPESSPQKQADPADLIVSRPGPWKPRAPKGKRNPLLTTLLIATPIALLGVASTIGIIEYSAFVDRRDSPVYNFMRAMSNAPPAPEVLDPLKPEDSFLSKNVGPLIEKVGQQRLTATAFQTPLPPEAFPRLTNDDNPHLLQAISIATRDKDPEVLHDTMADIVLRYDGNSGIVKKRVERYFQPETVNWKQHTTIPKKNTRQGPANPHTFTSR